MKSNVSLAVVEKVHSCIAAGSVNGYNPLQKGAGTINQVRSRENIHFLLFCGSTFRNDPLLMTQKKKTALCI